MREIVYWRIATLAFTAALTIAFKQPYFLFFLVLCVLFRQRTVKAELSDRLDALSAQLTLILTKLMEIKEK